MGISQLDHYVGALIVSLLNTAKKLPALFEETNESRLLQIVTDNCSHNMYVKKASRVKSKRDSIRYNTTFTQKDLDLLKSPQFNVDNYIQSVALILTDTGLSNTQFAVLPLTDALKCLSQKTKGGTYRITLVRYGNEHKYKCYGVGQKENNGVFAYVNHLRYFDEIESRKKLLHV